MTKEITSPYAEWRLHAGLSLYEGSNPIPPERLLQALWFHQRLRRTQLRLVDGRSVQVLHPGFWNREAGPDFKRAVLRFGDDPPIQGDVEIDLQATGWTAHRHRGNPAYDSVILHVVWHCGTPRREPVLELERQLDDSWENLARWYGTDSNVGWPDGVRGQCRMPLQRLDDAQRSALLLDAARTRLRARGARIEARAKESGWEAALWTFVFRALGYKQNAWPMQCLGEKARELAPWGESPTRAHARLLGVAGLLPHELRRATDEATNHHRLLWDCWWRERDLWNPAILSRQAWRLHQIRPANHPQRRLFLASQWLCDAGLLARLDQWAVLPITSVGALVRGLHEILKTPMDPVWSFQWTLRSARSTRELPLIGARRITDLAINAILPWLWIRACKGGNEGLKLEAERRYFDWPAGQDNGVLRLARHRLLQGEESRHVLRSAAAQQGLLQIVNDFCERSNSLCEQCPFPDLVRAACRA